MTLNVYGKPVVFSEKEEQVFTTNELSLDDEFMELLLQWNNTDCFPETSEMEERHELCIRAIEAYAHLVVDTLSCAEKEGLL